MLGVYRGAASTAHAQRTFGAGEPTNEEAVHLNSVSGPVGLDVKLWQRWSRCRLGRLRRLTGDEQLHAFVGSCQLTGAIMEPVIPRTLKEMSSLQIDPIVPGHCTGWKANTN